MDCREVYQNHLNAILKNVTETVNSGEKQKKKIESLHRKIEEIEESKQEFFRRTKEES